MGRRQLRTLGRPRRAGHEDENLHPKKAALLESYIERDRLGVIEDIRTKMPDIIVFERGHFDWFAWAKSDPRIARELEKYGELFDIDNLLVLRRKETGN